MINFAVNFNGPILIRYPRGGEGKLKLKCNEKIVLGKSELLKEGSDVTIIAIGKMVEKAVEVADEFSKIGVNAEIINARFLKPIDKELLDRLFKDHKKVVTIEDNVITGGFSTNINKFIIDNKYDIDIINIALPEEFIPHGSVDEIYNSVGLSPIKIAEKIKS